MPPRASPGGDLSTFGEREEGAVEEVWDWVQQGLGAREGPLLHPPGSGESLRTL